MHTSHNLPVNNPKTVLIFDTETTGLPSRDRKRRADPSSWPRLVEIGWILARDDGTILDEQSSIIIPEGFIIPEAATKIHGISHDQALGDGKPVREVLTAFCRIAEESDAYIAHNLSYDVRIVLAELIRMGNRALFPQLPGICTMRSSVRFCAVPGRFNKGYRQVSLSYLYHHLFQEKPEGIHRALPDAKICAACYFELAKRDVPLIPEARLHGFFPEKNQKRTK